MTAARLRRHGAVIIACGLAPVVPHAALAQPPVPTPAPTAPAPARVEVVRGRVLDDSARAVVAATVVVTRGPDRLVRQTATDSAGRFAVRFEAGTGDYLVAVSAPGFQSARRRVQRQGSERELVADFRLGRGVATLAGVRVRGERPARADNSIGPMSPEAGSSERWADGVNGQVPPGTAGDLNATAATLPGVTATATGVSILGSAPASTLTTLNGMAFPGAAVPRAARVDTRVTGATFDPTRGGFSGANVDVRLGPGDRNYQNRTAYGTVNAAALQAPTDAVGRALGVRGDDVRASVALDGELVRRALTYNVSADVRRSTSDPATLVDADPAALARFGVAPDSAARLLAVAGPAGLPLRGVGVPALRRRDGVTWLGRLDDTRDSLRWRTLTTYAATAHEGALGFGPLAAPSAGGERRDRTLGTQLVVGQYAGAGYRVWNETRLSAGNVRSTVDPYGRFPGAAVLVPSVASGGIGGAIGDVAGLTLGGGALESDERRWTAEGANETIWQARGRRHRFKAIAWGRADGLHQTAVPNRFGTFAFNSVADFAAAHPSSYTRTLVQPVRTGTAWNGAVALAHQWAPSRFVSVLYGARVEGNAFGARPAANPALERALGVLTGVAPSMLHVSPRAGFSWTYNRARDNGNGMSVSQVGTSYRTTSGVVRGGIGEFRDLLRPDPLADAAAGTGLPGSTVTLACIGAATPAVDWSRLAADPLSAPAECAGGGGALADRTPSVTLLDRRYDVPRSWRASLDWNTNVGRWLWHVSGLGSYDLAQPGTVDANFAGVRRFALDAAEGARPVFVPTAAIDAASGLVSAIAGRRSSDFGRVGVRTSDLRGYGGQLTVQVAPDMFRFRGNRHAIVGSAAYTLQATRRQFRGFDGANFGDPRTREWAAGPNDARHAFKLQGGFSSQHAGTLTAVVYAQSGFPFTPLVQGDVDGDGRGGDRAFIPAFAARTAATDGDPALAAGLRALAGGGSPEARSCLARYAGRVPTRNGCRGPWSQTFNVQWSPPLPRRWGSRLLPNVYLENVLGGVDQLLHGDAGLRGWGASGSPDPVLLVPRGFDAAAARYRYDVNPRFATTRGARALVRAPFRVSIDLRLDFGTAYPVQQLRRVLEPVRVDGRWTRRSADSILAQYLGRTSSIHRALLAESDSLFLTAEQTARLRLADSVYGDSVRAIYRPLARYLGDRPDGAFGRAELDSVRAAEKRYWALFWRQPERADSLVSPTQRQLFPMLVNLLQVPARSREGSRWYFGSPVPFVAERRPVPMAAPVP